MSESGWGGAREGAGRPSLSNGSTKQTPVALTAIQRAFLIRKFGSYSKGIRHLIDQAMAAEEADDSAENQE